MDESNNVMILLTAQWPDIEGIETMSRALCVDPANMDQADILDRIDDICDELKAAVRELGSSDPSEPDLQA